VQNLSSCPPEEARFSATLTAIAMPPLFQLPHSVLENFPLVHKVCMGVTAAMCGKLRRSLSA